MEKFYFTYGTDSGYPFRGGWSLIIAPNIKAAAQIIEVLDAKREKLGINKKQERKLLDQKDRREIDV